MNENNDNVVLNQLKSTVSDLRVTVAGIDFLKQIIVELKSDILAYVNKNDERIEKLEALTFEKNKFILTRVENNEQRFTKALEKIDDKFKSYVSKSELSVATKVLGGILVALQLLATVGIWVVTNIFSK